MRKYLIILIYVLSVPITSKSQDRFDDGTYCSPIIGIEGVRYKFYADTFETYIACDLGCLTIKGIYKIIGNTIEFSPIDPELLKKSIIKYRRGREHKSIPFVEPYNHFEFHVKFKDRLNSKINFMIWLRDSSDRAIMTFHCNCVFRFKRTVVPEINGHF